MSSSTTPPSIHLLVLVHGMWGNPNHLSELERIVKETYSQPSEDGTQLRVLLAETNRDDGTYDGIDWGGERVAQEVYDEVDRIANSGSVVSRFSITGYSLGGLVSRYVIGILHQREFFTKITPVNFNTIATPHIGLLRYPSFFSTIANSLGPKLLSRTGEQFYCVDKWSTNGRPLLEVMADPERIFYQGLSQFQHIRIYANSVHDLTVPYVTAAIELEDPFVEAENNGLEITFDDKYKFMIKSWALPLHPPAPTPKPTVLSKEWFKSNPDKPPMLPPFLQFRFPFNIIFYASLPIFIPTIISIAITRFCIASFSSRRRIKLLEKDVSNQQKLIHVMAKLERELEEAVVDFMENPSPSLVDTGDSTSEASALDVPGTSKSSKKKSRKDKKASSDQPVLLPVQRSMVASLNKLPNLQKELAHFTSTRNSHAMIICRDVKRFEMHRQGEGVVRHWAEHLIL